MQGKVVKKVVVKILGKVFIVLAVMALVLGPVLSCRGGVPQGTIQVNATLDGSPWSGQLRYTLTRPVETIDGTSVPQTFTVSPDTWTCAYISGGPGDFVNITPLPTQNLPSGGTITFTLNFRTPPPPPDASIEFISWSINGVPVPPGRYIVSPSTIIDIRYKQHVAGQPGRLVQLKEKSMLRIHYLSGPYASIWLHVVNHPLAVTKDPAPEQKKSQVTTVDGKPAERCTMHQLLKCVPREVDVETAWQLKQCTYYTKTINWLHIGQVTDEEVLFDLQSPCAGTYELVSEASVELEPPDVDVDLTNNHTTSPSLFLEIVEEVEAPSPPTLSSPAMGSTVSTLTPRLGWNASAGATSYVVQVATDSTFMHLVGSGTTPNLYSDVPSGWLNWNTTYYWRVNATNAAGTSAWSDYWCLMTAAGP